jgi:hypothetical protein
MKVRLLGVLSSFCLVCVGMCQTLVLEGWRAGQVASRGTRVGFATLVLS